MRPFAGGQAGVVGVADPSRNETARLVTPTVGEVIQHHDRTHQQRQRIGEILTDDVGCGTVHRLEDGPLLALVLRRAGELAGGPKRQQLAWSRATIAFALGQAGAAYGFSYLFDLGGSYLPLFALGAGAFVVALAINIVAARLDGNA